MERFEATGFAGFHFHRQNPASERNQKIHLRRGIWAFACPVERLGLDPRIAAMEEILRDGLLAKGPPVDQKFVQFFQSVDL